MLHTFDARLVVANTLMSAHTARIGEHDAALDHHTSAIMHVTERVRRMEADAVLWQTMPFHPDKIRFGADTLNGYTRRMFEDAWTRYLTVADPENPVHPPSQPEHRNNTNNDSPETSLSQPEHPETCSALKNASSTDNDGLCSSVPVAEGEKAEDGWLDV